MENYFADRETLGQFIDDLIATKYPGHPTEIYSHLRDRSIRELDERIMDAIIGSLDDAAQGQLEALLDQGEQSAAVFQDFFKTNHINLEEIITATLGDFQDEFLRRENA